jgi:hypothetical protein
MEWKKRIVLPHTSLEISKDGYLPHIQHSLHVHVPRNSEFRHFVINNFATVVSAFRDWFRRIRIRMEPHGLRVGRPQSPAIVQIIAAQCCTKWGWLLSYFSHLMYLCFQKLFVFYWNKISLFYAFWSHFIPLLLTFLKLLKANRRFALKSNSDVRDCDFRDGVICPNKSEYREYGGSQIWVKRCFSHWIIRLKQTPAVFWSHN